MAPPQPLPELPDACLQLVMRGLATRDQLAAAAACSRLRGAAAAALSAIAVPRAVPTQKQLDSLAAYASRHGQHISRLDLHCVLALALPPALLSSCPQLRELRLDGFVLQPGVLRAATGLSKLQLQSCRDPAPHSLAANVAAATGLAHLELHGCRSAATGKQLSALLPGHMLQALPQLTTLVLQGIASVDDRTLPHLSALTRLQELQLESLEVTAEGLEGLQHLQQLSSLRLLKCGRLAFSSPAFTQLQAMRSLEVTYARRFDPAALAAVRQLRRLVLGSTPVAAADTAVLLRQLGGLQQLSHLDLSYALQHSTAPAAAYSALTASSKLAFLRVECCALRAGAWQHVFPAGRRLPQLRELALHADKFVEAPDMSASDVARLAVCCPSLESLEAHLQLGVDLQPLVQLSALTRLSITGVTDTTVAALRHASSLRDLTIHPPHAFTQEALWHLVPLRQLTGLFVQDTEDRDGHYYVAFEAPVDGNEDDPPVWQQLLELCEQRMVALEAKVAEQRQQQDTQQQLEAGRQRRDEARARIVALQQHQQGAPRAGGGRGH